MTGIVVNRVRKGFYMDSVALMRISKSVSTVDGVTDAALMIGSPSNKQIMADAGLLSEAGEEATGNDVILGIRAVDEATARTALAEADCLLDQPAFGSSGRAEWRPKTLRAAVETMPDAHLAIISVPGEFAAAEARKALRRNLHVMVFSDNVSLEDEISLKAEARERGLLLMGPDCGTAIINGVPLAFANAVPRGNIGIVAASGTGLQEVSSLIARSGQGISHAIGTGGRDLSEEVGGVTTLMALDAVDQDPHTERIVLISKPPGTSVAARIADRVAESAKPFTVCFLGLEQMELPDNAVLTPTLKGAAEHALGGDVIEPSFSAADVALGASPPGTSIRGLFSGGALCAEGQAILRQGGLEIFSNTPVPGAKPASKAVPGGHLLIDLGADEYTSGRPHPMLDPEVRNDVLRDTLDDPDVAVVLMDIVIGFGAHEDPAGSLVAALSEGRRNGPAIVASVTGTEEDPQVWSVQVRKLENAGVLVAPSNAQAAELALRIAEKGAQ